MSVCELGGVYTCIGGCQGNVLDLLELELKVIVTYMIYVLETEPTSSARIVFVTTEHPLQLLSPYLFLSVL